MSRLMGRKNGPRGQGQSGKAAPPSERAAFVDHWWGKSVLLLLSVALFTFAFAPFKQFYLAWIALVPWLLVVSRCRSALTAFAWSWIGGLGFFIANMWWLVYVTGPGLVALMVVLGLYWGASGAIIRRMELLNQPGSPRSWRLIVDLFLIAFVWVGLSEWLRGAWPLGGLPWLYLGHTQSPVLHLCQVADLGGVYAVSFWVALINAWIAAAVLRRGSRVQRNAGAATVLLVVIAVVGYGFYRFDQKTSRSGPTVMVVQPNYPQSNSGEKGASELDILAFHLQMTERELKRRPGVDLVVWSETMMPPLNADAAEFAQSLQTPYWQARAQLLQRATQQLTELARLHHTDLLVGATFETGWTINSKDIPTAADRRNSAFFYTPAGQSRLRYDKVHLVPFGEYLPFKSTIPPLYRLFLKLSPYPEDYDYTLTSGPADALTVFSIKPGWRFVTPICFEDIDAALVRKMLVSPDGRSRRADFIVNITNDGWFKSNEMPQHLQAAIFRSIENRVPTARSVNTGISGFIDALGRTSDLIPADSEGAAIATISLDDRTSFYTRFGDLFAYFCAGIAALLATTGFGRWWKQRERKAQGTATR